MSVCADSTGPPTILKVHFVRNKGISGVLYFIASKTESKEERRCHEGKRHVGALSCVSTRKQAAEQI